MANVSVSCEISGDKELVQKFTLLPGSALARVSESMDPLGSELVSRAQALVSGVMLKEHKGKLKRGIRARKFEHQNLIRLVVGPRSGYGYALAIGSKKSSTDVKGYTRHYKPHDVKGEVPGKNGKVRVKTLAKGVVFVKPKAGRRVNLKPRRFMLQAEQDMRGTIVTSIDRAVGRAVKG